MERADETNAWHAVEIRQEKEHCDARDWQLELNNGEEFYSPEVAFRTPARVLISGLSVEKLLEGFSRHRSAFLTTSLSSDNCDRLLDELKMNLERIWTQNLGRDEQIMSWFLEKSGTLYWIWRIGGD
ncbi:hypothetical protein PPACK8108_LOCUS6802 [Phakopsora pachyrhizi]|uniref:Uncharacterized protein n=1 Tax=Phakopsora pachyrhizi TaxID=170000 RepID=A0AAV0ARS4_PHAPC|nr:hypothetical protein PPACK8108_LOCUS6802 [Phakopsora pachyrhizi]